MVDAKTRLYGVIGFPTRHSLSPSMHNAAFRALGINAVYLAFEVHPEELGDAIKGFRALSISGLNVTMPHKEAIIRFLDSLSEDSGEIGSVNTVVNRNGKLEGHTTDGIGARRALERVIELGERRILIIGAGGAGKAIAYELAKDNDVVVLNRTPEKAKVLERFGITGDALNRGNLGKYLKWAEVLINATPVGMNSWETPVPGEMLRKDLVVMDIVYKPLKTRLLTEAELRGCKTVDGLWMLVYQGIESFRLWTGLEPDEGLMRGAALESLSQ
ncbi:Shikimate 5-dehydrogenase I alpha [Thermococcus sp. 2319x1]|uniref:shikimate dehydrogenase n=1 Tax=Thermococcus sp. 2319x1 TaxID=1674923 RepID=UPI00073AA69E|nr:shikimate dehydrogenase [Thermococcus sp. 2319x1]ALV62716.1 Shikimate 5-dehydrogenase I alpha [Thermococcus sp. 2319x1]